MVFIAIVSVEYVLMSKIAAALEESGTGLLD
jgi:hypothetical protein